MSLPRLTRKGSAPPLADLARIGHGGSHVAASRVLTCGYKSVVIFRLAVGGATVVCLRAIRRKLRSLAAAWSDATASRRIQLTELP